LTITAAEIVARDQPNSSCSGSMRMLGAARNDPAPTRATKETAATIHARWIGHCCRGERVTAGRSRALVI
jgi:hypothetical protein